MNDGAKYPSSKGNHRPLLLNRHRYVDIEVMGLLTRRRKSVLLVVRPPGETLLSLQT